ncbi:hypothetical protein IW140_005669 [Coemansia sp. RSA 1813]|nr:hypothetical protein EV178_005235 [Coemansia sp. RSA 1646]KAJ1767760.1 hypothetical protein LPJ74_005188 [Coemansia sp. RSA 1843]KAJ2087068.1 hypothetical protein IW138_005225 [Coemansia sp. RSA 986]KAJ2212790.1 hypothetical protein EV179_004357 [Coemansia sp. RSA 487]KAJ2564644.1 hypothetical protein IW140_005669 [Coemansia sp. RSA 1813]
MSAHDANLVDILMSSAIDGEYIRDQISGTYRSYTEADQQQSSDVSAAEKSEYRELENELLDSLKTRERQAIKLAESGKVAEAVDQLDKIIADCPHYASAYNNRAQANRLLERDSNDVLADLDLAIRYANPDNNDSVLGQAYTQKGIVYRALGDQDAAFNNFSMGARYGNEVAKMAAPKENPYAKLCGKMVSQAMKQLRNPA